MAGQKYIESPLSFAADIYENNPGSWRKAFIEDVKAQFNKPHLRYQIPSINNVDELQQNIKSDTLVRYRCMIQDMWDPEFYLSIFAVRQKGTGNVRLVPGCYRDVAGCKNDEELDIDHNDCKTSERQVYYCVPIPGETDWVKQKYGEDDKSCKLPSTSGISTSIHKGCKRGADCDGNVGDSGDKPVTTTSETDGKKPKVAAKVNSNLQVNSSPEDKDKGVATQQQEKLVALNFPLSDEKGPAVIVKMYTDDDEDASAESGAAGGGGMYKLNDVVEFVGILSTHPGLATVTDDTHASDINSLQTIDVNEQRVHEPPASLIPRLHVLWGDKLQHNNPLIHSPTAQDVGSMDTAGASDSDENQPLSHIISVLSQALLGDQLAAEYLLANLLSSVYNRKDVMAVGKFTLNISGIPTGTGYATHLHSLLQNLLTKCHMIPLSLEVMNAGELVPRKDYTCDRLQAAPLQLSQHTHLTLDETCMEPGQLQQTGINNLKSLSDVIQWQKLNYDFKYHQCEFTTDIPVLIISDGKSMLPSDCHVPLYPNEPCTESAIKDRFTSISHYLTPPLVSSIRRFITRTQLDTVTIPDTLQQKIQADFVNLRASHPSTTAEHLHLLLVLSRLLALSREEGEMGEATWQHAVTLEEDRRKRVSQA